MTHATDSSQQAVAALFAERQRYEGWLAALEAKRTSTPPHIFERVHADYAARLQRVIEQFREHRGVIQAMADALADRLAELEIEDVKQRDARVEAELRAAVGEFTAAECQECVRRAEDVRATIAGERSNLMAELSRLRALLDTDGAPVRSRGEPAAAPSHGAGATPTSVRVVSPSAPAEQPVADRDTVEAANGGSDGSSSFDELDFLESVVGPVGDKSGEDPGDALEPPPERSQPQRTASTAHSTEPGSPPSIPPRFTTGTAAGVATGDEVRGNPEVNRVARGADAGSARSRTPSFLRDSAQEQVKTLRCQECQTMNYPTEWYCERCGAELAAL